jgi:hypothetical protein
MAHLKDCSFRFEIIENLRVHLKRELVVLSKDGVQGVEEHSRSLTTACEFVFQRRILVEYR